MSEAGSAEARGPAERSAPPLQCNCPSWQYRGHCKHADKALALSKAGYPLELPLKVESESRPGTFYVIADASAPSPGQPADAAQEAEKRGASPSRGGIPIPAAPQADEARALAPDKRSRQATLEAR